MITTAGTSSLEQSADADTNTSTFVMLSAVMRTDTSTTWFVLMNWCTSAGPEVISMSTTLTVMASNRNACDAPGATRHVLNTPLSVNGTSTLSSEFSSIGIAATSSSQLARTNFTALFATNVPFTEIAPTRDAEIGRPVTQRSTDTLSSTTAATLPSST